MPKKIQRLKGFTLLELLIVIAIIAILAAVVLLAINPLEILRKSRDSQRMSDLATLRSAINLYITEKSGDPAFSLGTPGTTYCSGASADCPVGSITGTRAVDGTGWIPIDFSSITPSSPIAALPVDPSGGKYFLYATDGTTWEADSDLEASTNTGLLTGDGGNNASRYEIGTNLNLLP